MNFFAWFNKAFRPVKPRPEIKTQTIIVRYDLTLDRWQQDPALLEWARTSEQFAGVLSVVQNAQPSGWPIRGHPVTDIQCAVELGRKEGYADCMTVLLALRTFPMPVTQEVPIDYDDTEYPEAGKDNA
jgi:hypothetical protein